MNEIKHLNQQYYDRLYRCSNKFVRWAHGSLSFNQKSKLRPNLDALSNILKAIEQEGRQAKILDYGCGWGLFLLALPKNQINAFCYDISEPAVVGLEAIMQMMGRKISRIELVDNGDILPNDFDIIVCSHVLEHVEDDHGLMVKLTKALRPGGHLLINVPINEVWADPRHMRSYNAEILRNLMVDLELEVEMERQACKWSGVIVKYEATCDISNLMRIMLRGLRLLLGILPYDVVLWSERTFIPMQKNNQLIMIGKKLGS